MGKVKVSSYVSKNSLSRRLSTLCLLACVASVSNRVTARELEREHLPLPRHSLFFCSRPNFLDELAMKRLLRRLFVCLFVFFVCVWYTLLTFNIKAKITIPISSAPTIITPAFAGGFFSPFNWFALAPFL